MCKEELYKNLLEDVRIKDFTGKAIDKPAIDEFFVNKMPEFTGEKSNGNKTNINLMKTFSARAFPQKGGVINRDNFFTAEFINKGTKCDEFVLFLPIYFKQNKEKEFRSLEINYDKMEIVEKNVSYGPGIRSVYWLQIFRTKQITILDKKNLEHIKKYGYDIMNPERALEWVIGNQKVFVYIYVSIDYRIRLHREELCKLCNEVVTKIAKMRKIGESGKENSKIILKKVPSEKVGSKKIIIKAKKGTH